MNQGLLADVLLVVYVACALGLLVYGVNCYVMVALFLRRNRRERERWAWIINAGSQLFDKPETVPHVTTQIPLYNEANVAERIIRAVAAMDYPKDRHEIQILDDSTDETRAIVDSVASELVQQNYDISVMRRENRVGFKAGALREGMQTCKGEFIAIFDADFVPPQNYLRQMVPALLSDQELGFVQARWGQGQHRNYSQRPSCVSPGSHTHVECPT